MAYTAQHQHSNSTDSLDYPEPNYPYLYARSDAGHTVRFTS